MRYVQKSSVRILIFFLVFSLTGIPVSFAETIECKSHNGKYKYCRMDTRGGVRLKKQLSDAPCVRDRTWGYDRGGIWVDRGCRALFSVGGDRYDDRYDDRYRKDKKYRYDEKYRRDHDDRYYRDDRYRYDEDDRYYRHDSERNDEDDDNDGNNGKALAIGIGALGALAVLGALMSGSGDQSAAPLPPSSYDPQQAPDWAVGTFKGYNPLYKENVELTISPDGSVKGEANEVPVSGYYSNGQIRIRDLAFDVSQESNGIRMIQEGNPNNNVVYRRVY